MKTRKRPVPLRTLLAPPEVFMVLGHALSIRYVGGGRWSVSVDDRPASATFGTPAEAWEAGVREVDLRHRQRSA